MFHPELILDWNEYIIQKVRDCLKEELSGFCNPDLIKILNQNNITRILVVGLAYDFCVARTAIDGKLSNLETYIIKDLTKGISDSIEIEKEMENTGVKIITTEQLSYILKLSYEWILLFNKLSLILMKWHD